MNTAAYDERILVLARHEAATEHRAAGKSGEPPTEAVIEKYLRLKAEVDADVERHTRAAAEPEPVAPVLADGAEVKKNYRELRTLDGRVCRAFAKGQPMAPSFTADGEMNADAFGAAIAAKITGQARGYEAELRALSTLSNSAGGVMVPETVAAEVIDAARAKARIFQAGAAAVEMNAPDVRIVRIAEDPTISLTAENSAIAEGDPVFDAVELHSKKHGCLIRVSNELLADGVNAGRAITDALSGAFASYLDKLVLDYLLASPDVDETDSIGNVDFDDLLTAKQTLLTLNAEPNACVMHPKAQIALAKLRDQVTGSYLVPPAALADLSMLDTTSIADSKLVMGDFQQLLIGIRQGVSIEFSTDFAYDRDQTAIRLLWRGDVAMMQPHFARLIELTY